MSEFKDREMELLRATRGSGLEMRNEELLVGRARLERDLAGRGLVGPREVRAPRRYGRRWALSVAIGGFVAATVLGVALLAPAPATPQAQAAELLLTAAEQIQFQESQLGPNQYQRVASTGVMTLSSYPEEDFKYQIRGSEITYVPADYSGVWVSRFSGLEYEGLLGGEQTPAAEAAARAAAEQDRSMQWWVMDFPEPDVDGVAAVTADDFRAAAKDRSYPYEVLRPGGLIAAEDSSPDDRSQDRSIEIDQETYANAPLDPDALREYILKGYDPNEIVEDEVIYSWVAQVLFDVSKPADLRAASLELLAQMKSATVTAEALEFGGSDATSVSFSDSGGTREELIFDTETGAPLGNRSVLVQSGEEYPGVEVGTVLRWSKYDVTVVDSIPPLAEETW